MKYDSFFDFTSFALFAQNNSERKFENLSTTGSALARYMIKSNSVFLQRYTYTGLFAIKTQI